MKIFIANTTKQVQQFYYRVPESDKLLMLEVPVGRQLQAHGGDLNTPQVMAIEKQLRIMGAIDVTEAGKSHHHACLCFSIDKPIKDVTMLDVLDQNAEVLTEQGVEMRKQAAVAIHAALDGDANRVNDFDVHVVEDVKPGDQPGLNEKIKVSKTGQGAKPPTRRIAA